MTQGTPPGWYPDGNGATRYWDGAVWTKHVQPAAPVIAPPPVYPQQQRYVPPGPPQRGPSHTGRNVLLAVLGIVVVGSVIGGIAAAASNSKHPGTGTSSTPGVSRGIGSQDASGDVTIGALTWDSTLTTATVNVTITNHSSKRSDYDVTVALESADGSTQIDTTDVFVQNLDPGQSSVQQGIFLSTDTAPPAGAKVVLQEVERTESS